jgi:hypothetical protein
LAEFRCRKGGIVSSGSRKVYLTTPAAAATAVLGVFAHADGASVQLRAVQHADGLGDVARVVELDHAAVRHPATTTHQPPPPPPPPALR